MERPIPENVMAELTYELGDKSWSALVTKGDNGWDLSFWRGDQGQPSGTFENTKALLKFIRQKAQDRFRGYEPTTDTLDRLKGRSPVSLVPDCYDDVTIAAGGGKGFEKCPTCPYNSRCGSLELSPHPGTIDNEESEADFMQRLRDKVQTVYGKGRREC